MISFTVLIADTAFLVECAYKSTKNFCREYLYEGTYKYRVSVSKEDIAYEKRIDTLDSSVEYLEILALQRKIAEILIDENVLLFHSSVLEMEGKAYVFSAPSGTGKSTHTRLWREYFKDKQIRMINDDKPFFKIGDEITAYGSPWCGKEGLNENMKAVTEVICFLKQGEENKIRSLDDSEILARLLQQTYRSVNGERLKKTIRLLQKMAESLRFYELECTISYDAVKLAYESMGGEKA